MDLNPSMETPDLHPMDQDPSMGTPDLHPMHQNPSMGPPDPGRPVRFTLLWRSQKRTPTVTGITFVPAATVVVPRPLG